MEPKYRVIMEEIRQWVLSQEYQFKDKLPTESELMRRFSVSRHTIRKALSDLETAGYVYRVQGAGTFVSETYKRTVNPSSIESVAVIATHINDYIFPEIIAGIEQVLSAESVSLILSSTQNNPDIEAKALAKIENSPISGLIVEPSRSALQIPSEVEYSRLVTAGLPIITMNSRFKHLKVPYFVMDDFEGGRMATNYVLSQAHRNILGVFKSDDQQGILRMNGFINAIQKTGDLVVGSSLVYRSVDSEEAISARLEDILSREARPTALVCYNDTIAVMAYKVANKLSLSIPSDLSIIGFDNSSLGNQYGLELTTINHPKDQLGKDAARLMVKMINNPGRDYLKSSRVYAPTLVKGNSVQPCENK